MPHTLLTAELLRRMEQFQLPAARPAKSSAKGDLTTADEWTPQTCFPQWQLLRLAGHEQTIITSRRRAVG